MVFIQGCEPVRAGGEGSYGKVGVKALQWKEFRASGVCLQVAEDPC